MAIFLIPTKSDNYLSFVSGSDASAEDEDEDETNDMMPVISRVSRSVLETPLDYDDGAGDPAPAADTAPAGSFQPIEVHLSTTEQPSELFSFTWRDFVTTPIPPESKRDPSSDINVGPTTPRANPYEIFMEVWDRQIIEHIASESNKCAHQVASQRLDNHNLQPRLPVARYHGR